jgi:hypothetical protein
MVLMGLSVVSGWWSVVSNTKNHTARRNAGWSDIRRGGNSTTGNPHDAWR